MTGPRHASVGSKHLFHARRARPTPGLGPRRGASQGRPLPTLELRRSPRSFPEAQSQFPSAISHPDPALTLTYLNRYPRTGRQGRPLSSAADRRSTVATHTCRSCARALHAGWSWPPGPEARAAAKSARFTRTRRTQKGRPALSLPRWLQKALLRMSSPCFWGGPYPHPGEKTVEVSRWWRISLFPASRGISKYRMGGAERGGGSLCWRGRDS